LPAPGLGAAGRAPAEAGFTTGEGWKYLIRK